MEKLIKRFELELMFSSMIYLNATKCAELSKKIAIDFVDYIELNYGFLNLKDKESLFTKFLETYEL